ncbi:unnamed protein product [Amoebophrya sp. A25]|nr:unnamed protein product [Amoebophrya sp. A25]|eukprot:GSA25T00018997001.1
MQVVRPRLFTSGGSSASAVGRRWLTSAKPEQPRIVVHLHGNDRRSMATLSRLLGSQHRSVVLGNGTAVWSAPATRRGRRGSASGRTVVDPHAMTSENSKRQFSGEAALNPYSKGSNTFGANVPDTLGNQMKFHHLHFYVNELKTLEEYKMIEEKLNAFVEGGHASGDKGAAREEWLKLNGGDGPSPKNYMPHGQDVVTQMIVGAGWRIAGVHEGEDSTSFHVCAHSNAKEGVAIVVTGLKKESQENTGAKQLSMREPLDHFHPRNLNQFFEAHGHRQGCAVLAFYTQSVDELIQRYRKTHPVLIRSGFPRTYGTTKILEVYAYYQKGSSNKADLGTVVRFVEETSAYRRVFPLPGMQPVEYSIADGAVCAAYPDHWVSNVFNREQVLQTFADVFGFQPKVNFNAGVVGAGEAVIESTVTGNQPSTVLDDELQWFKNQDQIYLPINNALSEHGHVHLYLEQVGQGVQHFASRVKNLPAFIARANRFREITGEGLAFLDIPRSYYGFLRAEDFDPEGSGKTGERGEQILSLLREHRFVDEHNVVRFDLDTAAVEKVLVESSSSRSTADSSSGKQNRAKEDVQIVSRGRYRNLYEMMGDTFSEEEYLRIVENKILVDVQGRDVLLQIFSKPVLMQEPGQQAPFFEFIQRVCDKDAATMRPGCGGFGIRNFLTLFLSIEVSNFMDIYEAAAKRGDAAEMDIAKRAVGIFTSQLNASNPILTQISDTLQLQTECVNRLGGLPADAAAEEREALVKEIDSLEIEKDRIQEILKQIGEEHKSRMRELMATKTASAAA